MFGNVTLTAKQYRERSLKAMATRRKNGNMPKNRKDGTFKVPSISKYKNKARRVDGIWMDSLAEADRFEQLKEMARLGTIDQLEVHPLYPCHVNGHLICTYEADFRYRIKPGKLGQRTLIEDVKGMVTPEYRMKRALVHALNLCEILELRVPKRGNVSRYRYLTADQFHAAPKE